MKLTILVCVSSIFAISIAYAQEFDYSFKESYEVSTPAQLDLSSFDGDLDVIPSDGNKIVVYYIVKKGGKLFTKKLLLKNTEHGEKIANSDYNELSKSNSSLAEKRKFKGNFITYAKRASKKMNGEEKILNQIKPHRKILKETIQEKFELLLKSKKPK